jgi:hypothetical protein
MIFNIYSRLDFSSPEALRIREMDVSPDESNELFVKIKLQSTLGIKLLKFISKFRNGYFYPEKCDVYEPIGEIFEYKEIEKYSSWLAHPSGRILLKKIKVPKYLADIENRRHIMAWEEDEKNKWARIKALPDPLFIAKVRFEANKIKTKIPEKLNAIIDLFRGIYELLDADFGCICQKREYDKKHFLITEDRGFEVTQYIGKDPEQGIPGIYWITVFGRDYVNWLGRKKLESLKSFHKESLKNGTLLIQAAEDINYFDSEEGQKIADNIIDTLGRNKFFDIRNPDRKCVLPEFVKDKIRKS